MLHRYSSRRAGLYETFLKTRLDGAKRYHRIAGYFQSSLLELAGEELAHIPEVRIICNTEVSPEDPYDEKPGIWLIANIAADLAPVVGKHPAWGRGYEYKRPETLSLLSGLDLCYGHVLGLSGPTYKQRIH